MNSASAEPVTRDGGAMRSHGASTAAHASPMSPSSLDSGERIAGRPAPSSSTARALALDLSELDPTEREALLASLPAAKRAELTGLIAEIHRLADPSRNSFEVHWERATDAFPSASGDQLAAQARLAEPTSSATIRSAARSALAGGAPLAGSSVNAAMRSREPGIDKLRRLNDGQLRALLADESLSVRLRVLAMLRSSELIELPGSLRKALTDHLVRQWASSELPGEAPVQPKRWWQALWRRFP
jgi:hypothetical protein